MTGTQEKPTAREQVSLSSITQGGVKLPPRTLMYGTDGIGKSTFWSQAPNPIFIPTEDGATRIDVPQFPLCETWTGVFDALRTLCRDKHGYQTVVLDSADWAQNLALLHVLETDYSGDLDAFENYGKGYRGLMQEWRKLLQALDYLHKRRQMEIALIAHAVVRPFSNPAGDDYDRYESNLRSSQATSIWAVTKEWCDIVLFANFAVTVKEPQGAKDGPKKGKGVMHKGDGSRVCHASPAAAWDAKVRAGWSLPDKFPLDQATFRKHIEEGV